MTRRLAALSILSVALALGYALYVQPGWEAWRDDQRQYVLLAEGLARRGEYTRAPLGQTFVPEPLRTPGYPLLLAPLCATAGCGHAQIAIVQALLSGVVPWLVFLLAAPRWGRNFAFACAAASAVYLPIAYYAALALADFAATLLMLVGLVLASRARDARTGFAAGTVLGLLALTRPQFVLFPLAVAIAFTLARDPLDWRARLRPTFALLAGAVLALVPLGAYSAAAFGAPFASSSGTGLWWGYFQGKGADAARVSEFRALALADAPALAITSAGAAAGLDPIESREAAAATREIAAFNAIDTEGDRLRQAHAWITLNRQLSARAQLLIGRDPLGYAARGLTFRTIELWAGELPIRIDDFHALALEPRILGAGAQLVLLVFGVAGALALAWRREREGLLVAACVGYTALALIAFVTEPRYSLPARPALILAAAFALVAFARRRGQTAIARSQSGATGAPA